jgi:hypothetical protein
MVRSVPAALSGALCVWLLIACTNDPNQPTGGAGSPVTGAGSGATPGVGTSIAGTGAAGQARVGTAGSGTGMLAGTTGAAAGRSGGAAAGSGGMLAAGGGGGGSSGGSAGTGPVAGSGTGMMAADPGGPRTAPGYMNLAPPMGAPLDPMMGSVLDPPAPAGWTWYQIEGAVCRDGSPTGFYVHTGTANKLVIFLEGGGACSNAGFCGFNPANVNQVLAGDGQLVLNTALGAIEGRQQPGVYTSADHAGQPAGIFDFANAANPMKDWSQVYVPYCTGDVHFGSKRNGSVPGLSNQQFVGYLNMKLFIGRLVPTFKSKVDQVILTGSSAGGFGAAANYSMVQDSFGEEVRVDVISDSGLPFDDKYMPVCMQKRWRDSWGLNESFPPDCTECQTADGGGIVKVADFLLKKHPRATIGMISAMEDEVIRLFFSVGLSDCSNYDAADPVEITVGQVLDPAVLMAPEVYTMGLQDLRTKYVSTNKFATFYMPGVNHQHIFRDEFYEMFNGTTQAKFMADFVAGKVANLGP